MRQYRVGSAKLLFFIFFVNSGIQQILGTVRLAHIYNTNIIVNYMNAAVALLTVVFFIAYSRKIKVNAGFKMLLFLSLMEVPWGILVNGYNSYWIRDCYNAFVFLVMFAFFMTKPCMFSDIALIRLADIQCMIMAAVVIFKAVLVEMGYVHWGVGLSIVPMAFAFCVYFAEKKWMRAFFTFLWYIWGGKRGILLGLLALFTCIVLFGKKVKKRHVIVLSVLIATLVCFVLYYTQNTYRISMLPVQLRGLFGRISKMNPFSENFDIYADGRMYEVISSLKAMKKGFVYYLFGMGNGFTYTVLDIAGTFLERNHHNVHVSPVSFFTKYGVLYTVVLYTIIVSILAKSFRNLNQGNYSKADEAILYYATISFVFSFVSYYVYLNYMFVFSLAYLYRKNSGLKWKRFTAAAEYLQKNKTYEQKETNISETFLRLPVGGSIA